MTMDSGMAIINESKIPINTSNAVTHACGHANDGTLCIQRPRYPFAGRKVACLRNDDLKWTVIPPTNIQCPHCP